MRVALDGGAFDLLFKFADAPLELMVELSLVDELL
jgi:hypothetical protein